MILPNVRASLGSNEIALLLKLLERRTRRGQRLWAGKLADEGIDALLDDSATHAAVMQGRGISAVPPGLAFYIMVRHTLLESGLDNRELADYVASLLVEFAVSGRAYRIARHDDKSYRYLVELVADLEEEGSERRQFLLRAHLGNFSLWLSGLFPDYVIARVHRKGAPGLDYYEDLGATGYRMASQCDLAERYDLTRVYREVAQGFRAVRRALNRVSDRFFFPVAPTSVDRLLRQVIDDPRFN